MLRQVKNPLELLVFQLRVPGTTQRALDPTWVVLCDQTHVRAPTRDSCARQGGRHGSRSPREEIFAWGSGLMAVVTINDAAN